ncbi:MAG: substrate-binding domain-containing protein [Tannerellaceae bacterium]|nr:substrate-binding domain-containing protein [Tannerellaceae bacterium]
MKRSIYSLIVVFACVAFAATKVSAENKTESDKQDVIYIKSVKFVTPLLNQWISEYAKVKPGIKLAVADKNVEQEEADIQLLISERERENLQQGQYYSSVGRYAVLPVAGKDNLLLDDFEKKRLNVKRLKELFFEKDDLVEQNSTEKDKYNATVYSGNNPSSVSHAFASHFGFNPGNLKGKKISGDDIYLINAIQKDEKGVSINNLAYLYDINSRRLKQEIAILPLDLKKEQSAILEESDLDKLIDLLESKSIDLIPVEEISFVFHNDINPEVKEFLQWVLSEGQAYNHRFGFLNLDEKRLAQQKEELKAVRLLTYSNPQ